MKRTENTMKKRLSKKTLISVCTLIAALIIWTMWSNTALMLSTVTVSSNSIPAAFNGFRIAQISDLHNHSGVRPQCGIYKSILRDIFRGSDPTVVILCLAGQPDFFSLLQYLQARSRIRGLFRIGRICFLFSGF